MYGWLKLDPSSGKRAYAAAECGLCAHFGHHFRTRTRMLAAADPTLLTMAVEAMSEEPAPVSRVRCPLTLKLTTRRAIDPTWAPLGDIAALQLVLAGEKLFDDALDREGLVTKVASGLLARDIAEAEATLIARGFPVAVLRQTLRRQAELEANPRTSFEGLASPTAEALALIAGWLARRVRPDDQTLAELFSAFARSLGTLLYTVDALHDLSRDRARQRFNPVDHALGAASSPRARALLAARASRLAAHHRESFDALPLRRHQGVLRASLVDGLIARLDEGLALTGSLTQPLPAH